MGDIIKFPAEGSKLGYKRVRKRKTAEDPGQLHLFPQASAQILSFAGALSPFEHALMFDERGDGKAAELYLKAIENQDCVGDAYCNLGILESQGGNTTRAFDCFTTALKHDPRHSEAHYNLGNLYFELNDFRLAQIHYEMAASKDKDFIVIEGATHGITPCTACEQTPGQYSNSVKNLFDYIRDWTNKRF